MEKPKVETVNAAQALMEYVWKTMHEKKTPKISLEGDKMVIKWADEWHL